MAAINSLSGEDFKISYRSMSGNPLRGIRVKDVLITIDHDSILCKEVEFKYSIFDVIRKKYHFTEAIIFQPTVILHFEDEQDTASISQTGNEALAIPIPFDHFPNLKFNRLIINDGSLIVKGKGEEKRFTSIQIRLHGKLNSENIDLTLDGGSATWQNRNVSVDQLSFALQGNRTNIFLDNFNLINDDIKVGATAKYQLQPKSHIQLNLDSLFVDLALVKNFLPEFPYQDGFSNITGSFEGMPQSFSGDVLINGVFDSLRINRLKSGIDKRGKSIQLTDMELVSNFGQMHGSLVASLEGKNSANLIFSDVNLKKLGILDRQTSIVGSINFDFENWDIQKITGNGLLILNSINIGGIAFDSLKLNATANNGNFTLRPPSIIVISDDTKFLISGEFSREQFLNLQISAIQTRLDTLFDEIGIPGLEGGGELTLQLHGPLKNPDLSGVIKLDSLTYQKARIYDIAGQLNIDNITQNRSGHFNLDISSGAIDKLKLTKGTLRFAIERNEVRIDTVTFKSDQNQISLQGNVAFFPDSIEADIGLLLLRYEDYLIQNSKPIEFRLFKDTLQVNSLELASTNFGVLKLNGFWDFSRSFSNFRLQTFNTRLEPFNQFLNWNHQIKGILTTDLQFSGNIYNPAITSTLSLKEVFFDNQHVGSLSSQISYQFQMLRIDQFHYEHGDSSFINLNGLIQLSRQDTLFRNLFSPQNRVELALDMLNIQMQNYNALLGVNFPLMGTVSGKVNIAGTMGAPSGTMNLAGTDAMIENYEFREFDIEGSVSPTRITVNAAKINFFNTDILARGFKNIQWDLNNLRNVFSDKSFELLCEINDDSLNFLYAFIPEVDRVIGNSHITARFGGDIDHPQLIRGEAKVTDGDLYLTKIENPIQDVNFEAHVEEQIMHIDHFKGYSPSVPISASIFKKALRTILSPIRSLLFSKSPQGDIIAAGEIDFTRLDRPKFNVDVTLKNSYFNYFLENARLVLSSDNLQVAGRDTIVISGSVIVEEANIELDFEESEKNVLLSATTRETPPYVQYILNVEIPDNFFVRSNAPFNTFDVEISGNVQILQEPRGALEMYGELNVISGKYFIQFEDFDITEGTLVFVNPKEFPELNLTARKRRNNYLFDLTVTGPINNPVKTMTTTDLETNEEIHEVKEQMAILLFGVRYQEIGGLGGSPFIQKGEEVLTQTIISQFEKEARYFTGLDRIRITSQGIGEDYLFPGGVNEDQVSTLALGKYVAPNLYLEYQTKLSYIPGLASLPRPSLAWESGNQIYLKYNITQNWSLSSIYQKTLRGNEKVQFDVNWQINF